ncbi:MAG: bifunctional diaminohydroxyphosphoribosylaminopyrimidine deaminase/5-amino-6-(5-phosphoribosylamino)uracil reductase RibD [Terriglobia bacterium]
MREALRLARQAMRLPYPNPWVGCVIVQNGKIVGRGFHSGPGSDHAETAALANARGRVRNATLYVNLEPCCHYGRTPPCTDAILTAGIKRVVYAIRDPNPLVAGKGAALLRQAGVTLTGGICAGEARALNEVYLKFMATGLPFVTVKAAASLDGKTATRAGESQWITDRAARLSGRKLRAQNQAVVVGINTVLADDPHLGPRIAGAPEPWRVILDSRLRLPLRARALNSGHCIVACCKSSGVRKRKALERAGARIWEFRGNRVPLQMLLRRLAGEGILAVLVEGGSNVLGSFFDHGMVDRIYWFVAPLLIGSERSRPAIGGTGVAGLADAWKLRDASISPAGRGWVIRGNLSQWALR